MLKGDLQILIFGFSLYIRGESGRFIPGNIIQTQALPPCPIIRPQEPLLSSYISEFSCLVSMLRLWKLTIHLLLDTVLPSTAKDKRDGNKTRILARWEWQMQAWTKSDIIYLKSAAWWEPHHCYVIAAGQWIMIASISLQKDCNQTTLLHIQLLTKIIGGGGFFCLCFLMCPADMGGN